MEGMVRPGKRYKQLPDDLKENRSYWSYKKEAQDYTLWRTHCGSSYGPVDLSQDRLHNECINYRIFWPITRALSIQKGSEIIKNEHAWYTLERFPTDNARVICTKKGIRKYRIMY